MLAHDEKVIKCLSKVSVIGFVCQITYTFDIFSEIIDVRGLMVNVIFRGD